MRHEERRCRTNAPRGAVSTVEGLIGQTELSAERETRGDKVEKVWKEAGRRHRSALRVLSLDRCRSPNENAAAVNGTCRLCLRVERSARESACNCHDECAHRLDESEM